MLCLPTRFATVILQMAKVELRRAEERARLQGLVLFLTPPPPSVTCNGWMPPEGGSVTLLCR